ncbi:MAG: hypothetical protein WC789_13520 [Lentisphaeria bacterium]|jgi:hypothetical protein
MSIRKLWLVLGSAGIGVASGFTHPDYMIAGGSFGLFLGLGFGLVPAWPEGAGVAAARRWWLGLLLLALAVGVATAGVALPLQRLRLELWGPIPMELGWVPGADDPSLALALVRLVVGFAQAGFLLVAFHAPAFIWWPGRRWGLILLSCLVCGQLRAGLWVLAGLEHAHHPIHGVMIALWGHLPFVLPWAVLASFLAPPAVRFEPGAAWGRHLFRWPGSGGRG